MSEPESGNAIANRVIARAQSVKRAAEAARSITAPPAPAAPAAAPAPAVPAAAPPAAPPAVVALAAPPSTAVDVPLPQPAPAPPGPAPVAPIGDPPAPVTPVVDPPASGVNPPPAGAPDRSWQALHSAEKRLADDRAAFKSEQASAPPPATPNPGVRDDPLGALKAAGWTEDQIAQMLVQRAESGAWTPAPVPAASAPPVAAQPAAPEPKSDQVNNALLNRLNQVESYLVKGEWRDTANTHPELAFISKYPGGIEFALERAALHLENTGTALTAAEGLAMGQGELIEREQARLATLRADPSTAMVLGLMGSPAAPVPPQPAATTQGEDEPPLTSISNDVAAGPGQPPQQAAHLTDAQRRKRAVEAMRAAART